MPVLEDADSIQVALMQVIRLILAGQLDPKIAGLLLYALQTASLNLRHMKLEPVRPENVVIDQSLVSQNGVGDDPWDARDFEEDEDDEEEDEDGEEEDEEGTEENEEGEEEEGDEEEEEGDEEEADEEEDSEDGEDAGPEDEQEDSSEDEQKEDEPARPSTKPAARAANPAPSPAPRRQPRAYRNAIVADIDGDAIARHLLKMFALPRPAK
jgi:hypothetical protein